MVRVIKELEVGSLVVWGIITNALMEVFSAAVKWGVSGDSVI